MRLTAALVALVLLAGPAHAAEPAAVGDAELAAAARAFRQSCAAADWSSPRAALSRQLWRRVDGLLAAAPATADLDALAHRVEQEAAPTTPDGGCRPATDSRDRFGQVSVSLRRLGDHLEARVAVGVPCGDDVAVALYHRTATGWRRYWRNLGDGTPAAVLALRRTDTADGPLVVTAERGQWCAADWQPLRLRLWRAGPGLAPRLLMERREYAYWGDGDGALTLRLDGRDLVMEFDAASIDAHRGKRRASRLFRVEGDNVRRRDPIALTPADFVEEWLSQPWSAAASWTDEAARDSAGRQHAALRGRGGAPSLSGTFVGEATPCRGGSRLWQVRMDFADLPLDRRGVAFLVRWGEGERFRLAAVRHQAWPQCQDPRHREEARPAP